MIEAALQLSYVVPVGVLVSLDVVVLTLMSGQQFREGERPAVWSATHALMHATFLAAGIGLFALFMRGLHAVFSTLAPWIGARLQEFAEWISSVAEVLAAALVPAVGWVLANLPLIPELLAVCISVGLCFVLYRGKIANASGKQGGDIGFSGAFKGLGTRLYTASVVAMDMWYLTPTLRNVISEMTVLTKSIFVLLLFCVVFLTVMTAARALARQVSIQSKEGIVLATLLAVGLILLEPIGVFYFAFYAAWKVIHPSTEHHVLFLVASAGLTWLMVRSYLVDIVRVQLSRVSANVRPQQA